MTQEFNSWDIQRSTVRICQRTTTFFVFFFFLALLPFPLVSSLLLFWNLGGGWGCERTTRRLVQRGFPCPCLPRPFFLAFSELASLEGVSVWSPKTHHSTQTPHLHIRPLPTTCSHLLSLLVYSSPLSRDIIALQPSPTATRAHDHNSPY